jgi:hypothetical protein
LILFMVYCTSVPSIFLHEHTLLIPTWYLWHSLFCVLSLSDVYFVDRPFVT